MCGIAGLVNLDGKPVSLPAVKAMTDAIEHRGPDDEGQWVEGNVGLGHRRLSIIDLSPAGHQPMVSVNHRYVLSYNGEIYNFKELRAELEARGYWFRSKTDSEVVLNALDYWGTGALGRFNGMFAFALWDRKERKLLLARDRYGIKPLYIARLSDCILFGSEQKAIQIDHRVSRRVDKQALVEYFSFQNIFTDRTLLADIKLLPAGTYLEIDLKKNRPEAPPTRYWDFDFQDPSGNVDKREYVEELKRLFKQAVNRQLVTDVELGGYLSGGMDSGSIIAIASGSYPYIKTFTCGFDLHSASGLEMGFDERATSEYMSYHFKTEHYEMVLKAGDMERCLPQLAWHLEEPRVGQSYPNFYAANLASKFVKVVLSGAGGDELFGGYPWRYYRAVKNADFEDYIDKYYRFWQRLLTHEESQKVFSPMRPEIDEINTREIFKNVFQQHADTLARPEDYINHSLYFEAKTFLHGLLVVEDKLSMAHGLETRLPFLDNDLVDFAMRCPVSLKLNNLKNVIYLDENNLSEKTANYFQKTSDGKQILRDAMESMLPAKISEAKKQGFSSPDASWFKGDSIGLVEKRLLRDKNNFEEFLDTGAVQKLVREHCDGQKNRRLLVWSLLNIDEWMGQNLASAPNGTN